MAFRGYFALDGVEIANSSRVVSHIGAEVPTNDLGLMTAPGDCSVDMIAPDRLLAPLGQGEVPVGAGRLLGTPPNGSRLYGPGLALVGDCWDTSNLCFGCRSSIEYDDSWTGLPDFLDDHIYRPELAPWATSRLPESLEFGGIWVLDVKGLDVTPTSRDVTENAGDGGAPGPSRVPSRKVSFDALLVACTNAGLTYGLQWLASQLRATEGRRDAVLRYLAAHPEHSDVDPASLVREVHGVVLSQEPQISELMNNTRGEHSQATIARVTWELTVTRPHAYSPPVEVPVMWDEITVEPIKFVHAADCKKPYSCEPMPALFARNCQVERIEVVTSPPPNCGGCLPVCAVASHIFQVPTFDYPLRSRETVASLAIRNTSPRDLTIQGYWRRCNFRSDCDDQRFPIQVNELPPSGELILDGVGRSYWVNLGGRKRRPFGIVGTPTGAPWRPAIIDRSLCWEFVVVTDGMATFEVDMTLRDREA